MKLIIDIDEKLYNFVTTKRPNGMYNNFDDYDLCVVSKCVRNGTPLQAELDEIKAKILNLSFTGYADKPKLDRSEVLKILDNRSEVLKILDNRIKELNNE